MATMDKAELLEEETFLVETSGEIPEVAFHAAVHHLTEDPEGPGLRLYPADVETLKLAVIAGYRRILMRDLDPENRDKGHFRGLERAAANWDRLARFAERESLDVSTVRREAAEALVVFLHRASEDFAAGREPGLRCELDRLSELIAALGVEAERLPANWPHLCRTESPMKTMVIPRERATFRMDGNGVWHGETGRFRKKSIIDHFNAALGHDADGFFVAQVNGEVREKVYFPCEETAFFAVDVAPNDSDESGASDLRVLLNTGETVPVTPEGLRYRGDALFLFRDRIPVKFTDRCLLRVAGRLAETPDGGYGFRLNGRVVPVPEWTKDSDFSKADSAD